jgi:hypothetical protein
LPKERQGKRKKRPLKTCKEIRQKKGKEKEVINIIMTVSLFLLIKLRDSID